LFGAKLAITQQLIDSVDWLKQNLAKRKNHAPQERWAIEKWGNTNVYEKLPKITTWFHMS
jgi:hypothetical protein